MKNILLNRWALGVYLYIAVYTFGGLTAHKAVDFAAALIKRGVTAIRSLDSPPMTPEVSEDGEEEMQRPVRLRPSNGSAIIFGEKSASTESVNAESRYITLGSMLEHAGGARIQRLLDEVLTGVHQVESNGKLVCLGDKGLKHKAYGPLQVRKPVCDDLAAFYGVKLTPEECQGNWQKSEYAFRLYVGYWLREHEKNGGRATAEVACRIWNGGPTGPEKSATKGYWEKVKAADPEVKNLVAAN